MSSLVKIYRTLEMICGQDANNVYITISHKQDLLIHIESQGCQCEGGVRVST